MLGTIIWFQSEELDRRLLRYRPRHARRTSPLAMVSAAAGWALLAMLAVTSWR